MTLRNAILAAWQRAGWTERQAAEAAAWADSMAKSAGDATTIQYLDQPLRMKPGLSEEEFINELSRTFTKLRENPDLMDAYMRANRRDTGRN